MIPKGNYSIEDHVEYEKLGQQLQEMTVNAVAVKFEIHISAVTAIRKLDDDDIRLIRELGYERDRMMARRLALRVMLQ